MKTNEVQPMSRSWLEASFTMKGSGTCDTQAVTRDSRRAGEDEAQLPVWSQSPPALVPSGLSLPGP